MKTEKDNSQRLKLLKSEHFSFMTYPGIKQEVRRQAQEKGMTISAYLENVILEALKKEGVQFVVKMERKVV